MFETDCVFILSILIFSLLKHFVLQDTKYMNEQAKYINKPDKITEILEVFRRHLFTDLLIQKT
jgi:hypothetical protein